MFDFISQGRPTIPVAELAANPRWANLLQYAKDNRLTAITRQSFTAYMEQRMSQRFGPGSGAGNPPAAQQPDQTPAEQPEQQYEVRVVPKTEPPRKVVVYRAGKLPKGLPGWFAQLDTDGDGQVSLYEWRMGNKDLDEFQEMDRNNDGYLTAEEVLRHLRVAQGKTGNGSSGTQTASAGSYAPGEDSPGYAGADQASGDGGGAGFAPRGFPGKGPGFGPPGSGGNGQGFGPPGFRGNGQGFRRPGGLPGRGQGRGGQGRGSQGQGQGQGESDDSE
jgi:hypothetical protein